MSRFWLSEMDGAPSQHRWRGHPAGRNVRVRLVPPIGQNWNWPPGLWPMAGPVAGAKGASPAKAAMWASCSLTPDTASTRSLEPGGGRQRSCCSAVPSTNPADQGLGVRRPGTKIASG